MNYWIVQCNPDVFDLVAYLRVFGKKPDKFAVSLFQDRIDCGDVVFVWKAKGSEEKRGIYAMGKVTARAGEGAAFSYGEVYWRNEAERRRLEDWPWWIDVEYKGWFLDNPLLDSELVANGLGGLLILKMRRRGVYELTQQEGETIQTLLSKRQSTPL